jgi:hypothetical protein
MRPRWGWWLMGALLLLAFAVRLHRLDAVDLRGDEAYSVVLWTATPFSEAWWQLWREEPAPAGAFLLYWAWNGMVGTSVLATRYLSLLGSMVGVAITAALTVRLWRGMETDGRIQGAAWGVAGIAVWLSALHPLWVWHAQDARVYGVQSALTPLCFYLLWRALEHENDRYSTRSQRRSWWLGYALALSAAFYIYYFEVLWLMAQGALVLVWALLTRAARPLWAALWAWLLAGALVAAVVAQAFWLMIISRYQGTGALADGAALFSAFVPAFSVGEFVSLPVWGGALVLGLWSVGIVAMLWRHPRHLALLGLWIIVPLGLLYLLALRSGFFIPRYVMTSLPAVIVASTLSLAALWWRGVASGWPNSVARAGAALLLLLWSGTATVQLYGYFYVYPPKSPDWRGLTSYLSQRTGPNDLVIVGSPDPAMHYYYADPFYIVPLHPIDLEAQLDAFLSQHDALYVLDHPRTESAKSYLLQHAQYIDDTGYAGVRHFRAWAVPQREIETVTRVRFGDVAILRGYTLLNDAVSGQQTLLLYWQALRPTDSDYSVLTHLVRLPDAASPVDGPAALVVDHALADGQVSTTTWRCCGLYRDVVRLNAPAGDYAVLIGLYPAGGAPLTSDPSALPSGRYALLRLAF